MQNFYEIYACALYNHIYLNSISSSLVDRLSSGFNYTLLHELTSGCYVLCMFVHSNAHKVIAGFFSKSRSGGDVEVQLPS
jgi:hypothetical protein